MSFVLSGILLVLVVVGVAAAIRAISGRKGGVEGTGQDLIPYGLLAIAVGITVFSLAQLGRAAFPGASLIGTSTQQVATALAGLVVGVPFAIILWRRQAQRRKLFTESPGWPLYLALVEAVLTTTLVVVVAQALDWILGDGARSSWTDVIVVGAAVGFHEWATREDPPGSDAAGLPRVVGSAIGLITAAIGVTGVLWSLLDYLYGTLYATAGELDALPFLILAAIGLPLWAYRWLRPWPTPPAMPRKTWLVATTVGGLAATIGSGVAVVIAVVTYVLADVGSAAEHFQLLPGAFSVGLVAAGIWWHHKVRMGGTWAVSVDGGSHQEVRLRDPVVASYQYLMAAIGLSFAIGSLTALAAVAFGSSDIIGSDRPAASVSLGVVALTSVGVWWWFWSRCQLQDRATESTIQPRRVYLLGMAVISGLAGIQALIAALVVIFQTFLGLDASRLTLITEGSLAILAAAATVHLLGVNKADRALHETGEVILPFTVTIVCSHPGRLAVDLPKEATARVIYRGDDIGVISDEMAGEIVTAVGTKSSIVWVDQDGFKVATAR